MHRSTNENNIERVRSSIPITALERVANRESSLYRSSCVNSQRKEGRRDKTKMHRTGDRAVKIQRHRMKTQ